MGVTMTAISSMPTAEVNVRVAVHDVADLRAAAHDWDSLTRRQRHVIADHVPPERVVEDHNTTCIGLHEAVVDHLDTNQTASWDASHLAVGTDDSSFQKSDTALNTEVGRFAVTSTTDSGAVLETSTFVDTGEANGNTLREVGLVTASSGGKLLNHSEIADVAKNSNKTLTIGVNLEFQSV